MIIIVAGPALSPSAFHCAGIGHWAFADDARLNAEHWPAAAEGKSGYRVPSTLAADVDPIETAGAADVVAYTGARARELIATIPDDLSIPAFLRRAPTIGDKFDKFHQFPADPTAATKFDEFHPFSADPTAEFLGVARKCAAPFLLERNQRK